MVNGCVRCACVLFYDMIFDVCNSVDLMWNERRGGLPWIFGWFYCRSKFRKTLIGCDFVIRFTGILSPPGPFLTPSPSPSIPASPRLHPSPSQSPFHSDVILITNSTNSDTVSGESFNFIWCQPLADWTKVNIFCVFFDFFLLLKFFRSEKRRHQYVVNRSIR